MKYCFGEKDSPLASSDYSMIGVTSPRKGKRPQKLNQKCTLLDVERVVTFLSPAHINSGDGRCDCPRELKVSGWKEKLPWERDWKDP